MQLLLNQYLDMNELIHIEILQRILLKRVSEKLESTYEGKQVIFWRIRASEFKL